VKGGGVGVEEERFLFLVLRVRECRFLRVVKLESSGRVVDFEEGERNKFERSVNG